MCLAHGPLGKLEQADLSDLSFLLQMHLMYNIGVVSVFLSPGRVCLSISPGSQPEKNM